jgi:hypothetical protein
LCLLALLACAPAAPAEQEVDAQGAVEAVLTFSGSYRDLEFSDMWLQIFRGEQLAWESEPWVSACGDATCWPGGGRDRDSVRVRDLDGDGEAEVLVDLYSGGAHCCFFTRIYGFDGQQYHSSSHGFADAGYRLGDLDEDGLLEFVSGDTRFAYRYTAFAFSRFPVQIWAYDGDSALIDVTSDFPGRVRSDARRLWRGYRSALRHDYEPRGAIAAWAADRYKLGKRRGALLTLRALARRRRLPGTTGIRFEGDVRSQLRFVRRLDRDLRRLGYA